MVAGILARALRFALGVLMAKVFIDRLGLEVWGAFGLAGATLELAASLDFAVVELFAFEAAHVDTAADARSRFGQAAWMLVPSSIVGVALLSIAGLVSGTGYFEATRAHAPTLRGLFVAAAAGYPFVLFGNVLISGMQGLGRLRTVGRMHAISGLLDVGVVMLGLWLGLEVVKIQWARAAGNVVRVAWLASTYLRIGVPLPMLGAPRRERLRSLARYCFGYSISKALGMAMYRTTLPLAQGFASAARLGAYETADRCASPIHRIANPLWDAVFPLLARGLAQGASPEDRAVARRSFLGGTVFLAAFAASYTCFLGMLGPHLLARWFGRDVGALTSAALPWILAAWSVNVAASMCTATLLGSGRARASNLAHGIALAIHVAVLLAVGPRLGAPVMLWGPLVANAVLALGLALAASRAIGVAFSTWLAIILVVFLPAGAGLLARPLVHDLGMLVALTAVCTLASLGAAWSVSPEVRQMAMERWRRMASR